MKGGIVAAVAAMAGTATAHNHRHGHNMFARRGNATDVCVPGCTTIWTTVTGEPTLVPNPKPTSSLVQTSEALPTTTEAPVVPTPEVPLPTPIHTTCPTPGTYTFPATTVTVSETTTVCVPETTKVPAGTHTVGGVTTVVVTATTVTCPYATVTTSGSVTTSVILTTEYVCPSAGTYTIAPITTTVTEDCDVEFPVPTVVVPGTYTAPEKVVTVTETDYVYVCPFTSSGLPAPKPEPTKAPEPTKEAPAPKPTQDKPKDDKPVEDKPKDDKPKGDKPSKPSPGGPLRGSNDHYGITYTPYDASTGDCKTADAVKSDIKDLKAAGFSIVRVYSTDCDTLETVGDACEEVGLELIVGVFVKGGVGCSYDSPSIKEQIDGLAAWGKWDMVKLFVVGNEAIMNNFCTAEELAELISVAKSKCSAYTGPWTISETLDIWQRKEVASAICGVVDVTGANIHPYFNGQTSADKAGKFVKGQLELLAGICEGNDVINLECGWPTRGVCNGEACPGEAEQATAIQSIREEVGDKTVFFSVDDDQWKEPGACECEQSWGCKSSFL